MKLDFDEWAAINAALWEIYLKDNDAESFIRSLKKTNSHWLAIFATLGYRESGGIHGDAPDADKIAVAFINAFADKFLQDLIDGKVTDPWGAYRSFLYASEGSRMAYMLGQQQAMKERGAKAWRRVLHPESSESGPCPLCIADSMIVHSIDEPFESLHVHEQCTQQSLDYYPDGRDFIGPETPTITMPVPQKFPTALEFIKKALAGLGEKVQTIVRRVMEHPQQTNVPVPENVDIEQARIENSVLWLALMDEENKKREKREKAGGAQ